MDHLSFIVFTSFSFAWMFGSCETEKLFYSNYITANEWYIYSFKESKVSCFFRNIEEFTSILEYSQCLKVGFVFFLELGRVCAVVGTLIWLRKRKLKTDNLLIVLSRRQRTGPHKKNILFSSMAMIISTTANFIYQWVVGFSSKY